ncbi:MAG: hypothetical protein Q4C72_01005 [Eubacteriales bacterium]|nr:hypothetical protein [Eubacteriales bacterium]
MQTVLLFGSQLPVSLAADAELFTIYDAGLSSLEATAGSWNKPFQGSVQTGYVLTLAPDEPAFCLRAVPDEPNECYGPTVTIDGEPVAYGRDSQEFTLAAGEKRSIQIVSTPQDGGARTYEVTAHRAAAQYTLTASPGDTVYGDGSRQVKLEVRLSEGTKINSLGLDLRFDPKQLKLAKPADNTASTTLGTVVSVDSGLTKTLLAFDPKADNSAGRLRLDFSLRQDVSTRYYTATAEPLFTVCFRLEPGGALTDESLGLGRETYRYGAFYGDAQAGLSSVAYADIARWEGLTRAVRLPENRESEGGRIQITPDKPSYGYGETVTLTAAPDEGYGFAGWTGLPGEAGEENRFKSEFQTTLWEDTDLSGVQAAFDKLDEVTAEGVTLDYTSPYLGGLLTAFNPPYGTEQTVGGGFAPGAENGALDGLEPEPQAEGFSERGEAADDPQGLTEAEFFEQPLEDTGTGGVFSGEAYALDELEPGVTERTFQMRDARVSDSGSPAGWAEGNFRLTAVREVNGQNLCVWLCTDAERQPVELTEDDLAELADSFADSYAYLAENLHPVEDKNGSGGLDILLYDIWDSYTSGGSTYTGGFINANEFYGLLGPDGAYGVGNSGDVLHLDTWPQMGSKTSPDLEKAKSTMAHETQHLSMCSGFDTLAEWSAAAVPTWINEGLSMTVEHALFGALESRIQKFNTSDLIRKGDSLTAWGNKTDDYAQAYLFFQYLRTQAGDEGFARKFYGVSYKEQQSALKSVLRDFPAFADKGVPDVMRDFYLALLLKENAGPYGFMGDPAFAGVEPQKLSEREFNGLRLAPSGAVYAFSAGSFTPAEENAVQYTGVTEPCFLLTLVETEGGSARAAGGQMQYGRGATAEITAAAQPGWRFAGWTGDASGADNPLTLRMDGDKTVTPLFEPIPTYALTLAYDSALGSVEVTDESGAARQTLLGLAEGTVLTLTAKPLPGAQFGGWTGAVKSTRTSVTVTMDGDQTVAALFSAAPLVAAGDMLAAAQGEQPPTVDAAAGTVTQTQAGGTVVLKPATPGAALDENGSLPEGTEIVLRAEPAAGKVFRCWQTFARNPESQSLEQTYGVVEGEALTDTRLRDPVLRTVASGMTAYRAVFADPSDPTEDELRLAYLKLLAPEGRNFIQTESRQAGFSSTTGTYDLYLVSTDAAGLTLNAVCKGQAGGAVRGELRLLRGTQAVGDPVGIVDYAADETEAGGAPALQALTVPDVRDGDVLIARVWDGTPEAEFENAYRITIHRTAAENDPAGEAVFEQNDDGFLHLSVYYQNTAAEAATISIPVAAGALTLYGADGEPYAGGDPSGLSLLAPEDGYTLEKARLGETPDENGRTALELTVGLTNNGLTGQKNTPVKVLELLCGKSDDAPEDWFDAVAPVLLYDADRLELEFTAKVTEVLPGRTVTGTFLAYNPHTVYTGAPDSAFQVYLKEPGGVREVRADTVELEQTAGPEYGLRTFAYTFDGSVSPGVYVLTVRKPAHTVLTINNITVGGADLDLDAVLQKQGQSPPALTVGDVDGDGWVRTYDKALLTNAARYGARVSYPEEETDEADPNAVYDLDGDGFIRTFDLYLLLPNYGRGGQSILVQSEEANA